MKKELILSFLICLFAFSFASCGDDSDDLLPVDEEWKAANEAKIEEIAKDPRFTKLKDLSEGGYLYYRVIEEGPEGPELIKYGEQVKVEYVGQMIDGVVFDSQLLEEQEITSFLMLLVPEV
ncbi:MAG: hypothetical protein LIP01_14965 [Tannerellaceae bacterium]|nr:hypothetical protein [Tannerellaceae bacterium]